MIKRELFEKYEAKLEIELLAEGKYLNLTITRANFENICKIYLKNALNQLKKY